MIAWPSHTLIYLGPVIVESSLFDKDLLKWENISIFFEWLMLCRRCATTAKAAPALSKTMTMPSAQRRGHLEWWRSLLFFKVRQKFVQDFTCDQSWIAEFGLITADSDEKRLHQNNGFQFRFQYQNRPILSTVFYPIVGPKKAMVAEIGADFAPCDPIYLFHRPHQDILCI